MAAIAKAELLRQRRAARLFRRRVNLDKMRDVDILSRYRLTIEGILFVADTPRNSLDKAMNRSQSIPVPTQVLIGLRYLAKGDLLSEEADLHEVNRCLHRTGVVLYRKPGNCCKIVVACARLHDLCMDRNISLPQDNQLNGNLLADGEEERLEANPDVSAVAYRQHIIDLFN